MRPPGGENHFRSAPFAGVLEERLRSRGTENQEQLAVRIAAARREILESPCYDYLIVNDDLQEAVEDLKAILRACGSSREARAPAVKSFLMSLIDPTLSLHS